MGNRGLILLAVLVFSQFISVTGKGESEKVPSFHLTQLLENKIPLGLSLDTPEERAASELEVQTYLRFRTKALPPHEVAALRAQCDNPEGEKNPFCPLIADPKFGKVRTFDPFVRKQKRTRAKAIARSVIRADIKGLIHQSESMTEGELGQALRFVKSPRVVESVASKVLKLNLCSANHLMVALGLRLEHAFPNERLKTLAEQLYERAFACGKNQSAIAGGYRLGLYEVWANRCAQAEGVFAKIPESPLALFPIDYRMRIDYWRAVCATQMKNSVLRESLENKILRNYPLSLHALLVTSEFGGPGAISVTSVDPEVILRPRKMQANSSSLPKITRDIEILLEKGEKQIAAILLKASLPLVVKAETAFQFYWAALLQKAEDLASSFQLVASLFRLDPKLISETTLRLMYPLVQFETIQRAIPQGDPFLILSLVRQESAFDAGAQSSAGAQGLMQLQWSTARQFERISSKQLWDPQLNLRVGVKYLNKLQTRFGGRLDQALAAYNVGPERIKAWSKQYSTSDSLLFLDLLPLQETRDYVTAIARNYYWYRRLYPSVPLLSEGHSQEGRKLLELLSMHSSGKL